MIGLWLFAKADEPAAGSRLRCRECRSEVRRGDAKVLRSVGGGLVCLVSCYECGHERRIPMPETDSVPPSTDATLEHAGQRTMFEGGAPVRKQAPPLWTMTTREEIEQAFRAEGASDVE